MLKRLWIEPMTKVDLVANQASYQVTVQALEGVRVRGRFVDAGGVRTERSARVVCASTSTECPVDDEDRFASCAIKKNTATELYVYVRPGTRVLVVPISAQQAAQDVDLGDIVLPERPPGRKVAITVNNVGAVHSTRVMTS